MSTEFFIICNIVVWAGILGYLCYYIFDGLKRNLQSWLKFNADVRAYKKENNA